MPRKRVTAKTVSISCPNGGWNARDSIAEMPETDCVELINLWPQTSDIRLRLGWRRTTTGFPNNNPVNTVATWNGAGTSRLFGAQGNFIYDCTGATAVVQNIAITNDRLQYINNSTAGGNFLVMVNGSDTPRIFDGTNWIATTNFTAGSTISSITVVGTTATVTTAVAHNLIATNQITLTGATPTELNGAWLVATTPTATTFTFTLPATTTNATVVGTYLATGFTGVDARTLNNINLWKNRQWYTPTIGSTVYYGDVNAVTGALSPFPLGSVLRQGGTVTSCFSWTIDAGSGVDDYIGFVTDKGEYVIYAGTNPSDASMFSLKGVWQLGATFTNRNFHKYGGDVLILARDGVLPLASALQSSRLDPRVNLSDKIYNAISQAIALNPTGNGWQIIYYPDANMLVINVPTLAGTEQYVMNSISKAWARFTNIQAYNFVLFNDALFFGGDGYIGQYWSVPTDNGNNVVASAQSAYSYFGGRGQLKRFTLARPTFLVDGGIAQTGARPGVVVGINIDFATVNSLSPATFAPSLAAIGIWDRSLWDSGAVWGSGQLEVSREWQGVSGIGYAGSMVMNIASQGIDLRWTSSDLAFEPGAVL